MTFRGLKYFPYKLKFKKSLATATNEFTEKDILIVFLEDNSGRFAAGEAAPLPEFTTENFSLMVEKAQEVQHFLRSGKVSNQSAFLELVKNELKNCPSLKFALEHAVAQFTSRDEFELGRKIKASALVSSGSYDEMRAEVVSGIEIGIETFKLKAGHNNIDAALKLISDPVYAENIFRIDSNGVFKFDEAVKIFDGLNYPNLEYIEQPVSDLEELIELQKAVNVNIAPDESISTTMLLRDTVSKKVFNYFVIKPMVYGSFFEQKKIIEEFSECSTKFIISSSFETSIARSGLRYLASRCKHDSAHGIIPGDWYLNDLSLSKNFSAEEISYFFTSHSSDQNGNS